jgi:hypothetical protein
MILFPFFLVVIAAKRENKEKKRKTVQHEVGDS